MPRKRSPRKKSAERQEQEPSLLDLMSRLDQDREPSEVEAEGPPDRDLPPSPSRAPARRAPRTPVLRPPTPALRLESLRIENLWCYEEAHLKFDEGITVIAGPNGSGKSSLLESIFFALYGSKAGPAMDRSLGDVLRMGASRGSVELCFRLGDRGYTARMELRRRRDGTVVSDREGCRLRRDDGAEWVGVEEAVGAVEELFGMNRDDFTNCVYVRQGEVDRLIRATGEERRRMIDRLLRLEKLDDYARRAREGARRAVHRRLDALQGQLDQLRREREQLEAQQLEAEKRTLQSQLREKQQQVETLEAKMQEREAERHRLEEQQRQLQQRLREIRELLQEYERKEAQRQDSERKLEQYDRDIEKLSQQYKTLERQLKEALPAAGLVDAQEAVIAAVRRAEHWDDVGELAQALQALDAQEEQLMAQRETQEAQIEKELEELRQERERLQGALGEARARRRTLEEELERMRGLLEQGRCPTCRQPLSEQTFQGELEQKEAQLAQTQATLEELQEQLKTLERRLQQQREAKIQALGELDEKRKVLQQRRKGLDRVRDRVGELIRVREQGRERRALQREAREALDRLADDLAALRRRIAEKREQLGDRETLETQLRSLQQEIQALQQKRRALEARIGELHQKLGQIEREIQRRESLKEEVARVQREHERLQGLAEEVERLAEVYGDVKRELRARNIRALERAFNEYFAIMDTGASYRGVRVTDEYDILVELQNGSTIRPELLSGGERALINLALRSAIHQVLSWATQSLPLLFDEPTVYLDRDRIKRLEGLLEELGRRVGQVIVVSHEIGLVEGADHEYRTEKLSDNTSRVERVR